MKKWLLYLLIPIMLLQSNMTIVICTSFYYNQNYIEKYLCLQRGFKVNNCHGQCYLMKKLKDKQENEQKNFKVNFQEDLIEKIALITIPKSTFIILKNVEYPNYREHNKGNEALESLFRPPILA